MGLANPFNKLLKKGALDFFTFEVKQRKSFESLIDKVY